MSANPPKQAYAALRYLMLGGLIAALLFVSNNLIRYPAVVTSQPQEAAIYLVLLVALISFYAAFTMFGTRPTHPDAAFALGNGAIFGLLVAAMWMIEIVAGNILDTSITWVRLLYYGATFAVLVITLAAGIIGGQRSGRFTTGALLGAWSGLVSGLLVFLFGMAMGVLAQPALQQDSQTIAQFQRSGAPDLTTYLVSDWLVALTNHLWIGPLLGVVLGSIGGFIGAGLGRRGVSNNL